jgi:hypothetical protein
VDLQSLARDLDKLSTADAVVADSYIRYAFRKGAFYLLACLLATIGLVLLGLSLYWLLEQSLGATGAAALVGAIGCLLAGMVAVVAMLQNPGSEFYFALKMRKSAIQSLEHDIDAQPNAGGAFLYPASEALITSVVLPLMGGLIRNLRSTPSKAVETPAELSEIPGAHPADEHKG